MYLVSPFLLILSCTWRGKDVKGCGAVCWESGHHPLPMTLGKKKPKPDTVS